MRLSPDGSNSFLSSFGLSFGYSVVEILAFSFSFSDFISAIGFAATAVTFFIADY